MDQGLVDLQYKDYTGMVFFFYKYDNKILTGILTICVDSKQLKQSFCSFTIVHRFASSLIIVHSLDG